MDKLQQAFEVLGGVEWLDKKQPMRLVLGTDQRWTLEMLKIRADSWDAVDFCSDHEASALLLKAMLKRAEEKWATMTVARETLTDGSGKHVLWAVQKCGLNDVGTQYVGPTLFEALLTALSERKEI